MTEEEIEQFDPPSHKASAGLRSFGKLRTSLLESGDSEVQL